MIYQKVRKVGNSLIITIPTEEVERLGIVEGDLIAANFNKAEIRPILPPEIQSLAEESWQEHEDAYRYLDGR